MAPERVHYDALDGYRSYGLAWLGPLVYPLSLALVSQCLVYVDLLHSRCQKLRRWRGPLSRLFGPAVSQEDGDSIPCDACVDTAVICIMASETIFALLCLAQCVINFSTRSFVGGATSCDVQAFYAAYYTFSSMGLAAYGFVATYYIAVASTRRWDLVAGLGALIHCVSVILASLPLGGIGSYLFAKDYCLHNVESNFFSAALLLWYLGCVTTMLWVIARMRLWTKAGDEAVGVATKRRVVQLLYGLASYFVVFAWSPCIAIVAAWLILGHVYDSSAWRLYGVQAIVLHSNQLFVPLLFGGLWRYRLSAIVPPKAHQHAKETW